MSERTRLFLAGAYIAWENAARALEEAECDSSSRASES
jgi:hypothetical protein